MAKKELRSLIKEKNSKPTLPELELFALLYRLVQGVSLKIVKGRCLI